MIFPPPSFFSTSAGREGQGRGEQAQGRRDHGSGERVPRRGRHWRDCLHCEERTGGYDEPGKDADDKERKDRCLQGLHETYGRQVGDDRRCRGGTQGQTESKFLWTERLALLNTLCFPSPLFLALATNPWPSGSARSAGGQQHVRGGVRVREHSVNRKGTGTLPSTDQGAQNTLQARLLPKKGTKYSRIYPS